MFAFHRPGEAVGAAVDAHRTIVARPWPSGGLPPVRMGLDAGTRAAGLGDAGPAAETAASIALSAHTGQILLSESARTRLGDELPPNVAVRDLGVHRLRDLQHTIRLFHVIHPNLPDDFPPPVTLDVLPNNLPLQLTTFVGRAREIADIEEMLTRARLLTLTGAGGCGKTRLALQSAARIAEEFKDGVWQVELAAVSDPALVPHVLGSVFGLREHPGRSMLDTLAAYLHSKTLLLVLDNCEHVAAACAELAEALLRRCAEMRILATSREPLRLDGEAMYRVPSLSLPPGDAAPSPDASARFEAVRLFVERARLYRPEFRLAAGNAAGVIEVCRRLDGIPLAIELAAARVGMLSVGQIAERLNDRFRLLAGGKRLTPARHRTLRATIDWSYFLLPHEERVLLRRLSVFAGGCALEAAETVCAGRGIEHGEVLQLLGQLVDKSLVVAEERHGEMRYRLLETVRQYAGDRLREAGETAATRQRHGEWCLVLTAYAERGLDGPEQVGWLERLEAEHDNLRAALDWARTQAGPAVELRLAGALWWYWFMRGHWSEGRRWLEGALSRCAAGEAPPGALLGAAYLAWRQGDYTRATTLCHEALALCETRDDQHGIAVSLLNLGNIAAQRGAYKRAWGLSGKSLALGRRLGDNVVTGWALAQRGALARIRGDYERAAALYGESLTQVKAAGNPYWTAFVLRGLGDVALKRDDHRAAAAYYVESLTLSRVLGDRWITEGCLAGLAAVACAGGQYRRAARLFGAVEARRTALDHHLTPVDQADYDRLVKSTRARLGDAAFAAAWHEGRVMPPARLTEFAAVPPQPATDDRRTGRARPSASLTPREQEVAALIAQGLNNREIADSLLIRRRTTETHVRHILDKLGIKSRTQIVAWAISHGLHSPPLPGPVATSPAGPAKGLFGGHNPR